MKYWAYLVAKLVVAGAMIAGLRWTVAFAFPRTPTRITYVRLDPFTHDLTYTFVMLLFTLAAAAILWLAVWDQRYRCRTCLRRLRMPVARGSWNHVLLGAPQTEYICPYGHGTLTIAELQITGHQNPDWAPHEDIWKELYSLEQSQK